MKKRGILIALAATLFVSLGFSAVTVPMNVTFNSIPSTIEEFVTLRDQIATTPTGGAAMFVMAMINYEKDKNLGLKCFTAILVNDSTWLKDDPAGYGGKSPNQNAMYLFYQLDKFPYLGSTYVVGTVAQNGYALPAAPYKCSFSTNAYSTRSDTEIKVFVYCTGGVSARPMTMLRNDRGIWKVKEFSSLVIGVANLPPVQDNDDI